MGKTDSILDIVGERFDTAPVPTLYVGPTRSFVREQIAPRFDDFLRDTPALRRKLLLNRQTALTRKKIAGVPLRLAFGGSSAALKSDPIGLAITDEVDEMLRNVKGAGDPVGLVDQRGDTFPDFCHFKTSTPSLGASEVVMDDESQLEFWAEIDPQEVESAIWRLWQAGTRHHWAWPCPHCGEYFIPRHRNLFWAKEVGPDGRERPSDAGRARATAHLICPRCGCEIYEESKAEMNAAGVYVAPGQRVAPGGVIIGPEPEALTISYWVSGLASPFVTFGDRAAAYVEAVRQHSQEKIQAVVNGGFGELFAPGGGDVPEWRTLEGLKAQDQPYLLGECPEWVQAVTLACDVQANRLVYGLRGWGPAGTSCLLQIGELWGDTVSEAPWEELSAILRAGYAGHAIRLALIDSGFRPGKPTAVPENRVYSWCSLHRMVARPTKGRASLAGRPILPSKIEAVVNWRGRVEKAGIELLHLDTDYFKRALHEKMRWPVDQPGAFLLPVDVPDYYLQQLVSEARIRRPGGRPIWVRRSRENHFLDVEAMQQAAGWHIGAHRFVAKEPAAAGVAVRRKTLAEQAAELNR